MNEVKNVTVIGSGSMGHQIGMLCALGGYETVIQDINEQALQDAESKLHAIMDRWVSKDKISENDKMKAFQRLRFSQDLEASVKQADLVIEAVTEKLVVKREVFRKLEAYAPPHTVFATNSSTIVNSLIADVTGRPDKVVNMHFFFPPLVMDLVEVVKSDKTSDETAALAMEVCRVINRTGVLLEKEISGFVANRILGALQKEAVSLYEQGIADFKDIDLICKKALNHPIGPFELMDLSGLDVAQFVMEQRYQETGDPADKPFDCILEKVEKGELGRKTGRGFYDYSKTAVTK
ncbi:3-hydroxyacyl-CoA dehydrogenase family protein [Jeotgalibacillus haloalkalitolerans]|uniref:3-hydroxyacyl-CoA dehydrogenase family protein n=1 Tax=Jeotgalibacillus haloalkalitolerans TaxID=3104292 RepID=A0ABU5KMZ4_9BACL|nr:3-hydroxyacyl-CoA dehydrogenase family protein [Jeotgalibacillus sp. HH7-29]MDZ5712624.1 3-hydroxyacyl-CoA dehydrogenase family protein [Jeotgalibacillus sp. HH7-29]